MAKGTTTTNVTPMPVAPVMDITKMTAAQIAAYLEKKKEEEARLAAEQGERIRGELEAYCQEQYGVSLEAIGLVPKMERTFVKRFFKNPANGEVVAYANGKLPAWLKNEQGKLNMSFQCNEDGTPLTA
jgi:hypothetical protein